MTRILYYEKYLMKHDIKYKHSNSVHNLNSSNKVVPIIIEMFKPASVLDVGCGIGTWLKSFIDLGVVDVLGIDGDYVNREQLSEHIEPVNFLAKDLSLPFDLGRKFDVVISLEVAEHLPESTAAEFVDSLVKHGDIIIFSAAIPSQGGQNHLNEQWKKYWIDLFARHQYSVYDLIRPRIWDMQEVDYWYKQNMIVFGKFNLLHLKPPNTSILEAIHPEMFAAKLEWLSNYINRLQEDILLLENRIENE